jgi:hypothetical protein
MKRPIRRLLPAALLLLVGAIWLFRPDPRVARAKALRSELFGAAGKQLPADQRRQKWQEYRAVTKGLTPAQRRALGGERRKQKQREIGRYFRMSPQEKARFLDAQIRREQQMRQSTQAGGGAAGWRGPGGANPFGKRSEQERDQRRQGFLDATTPAERAQMHEFMRDLSARRQQLGMRR